MLDVSCWMIFYVVRYWILDNFLYGQILDFGNQGLKTQAIHPVSIQYPTSNCHLLAGPYQGGNFVTDFVGRVVLIGVNIFSHVAFT